MLKYAEVDRLFVPMGLDAPRDCMTSFDVHPADKIRLANGSDL